ncbi:MAG: hypothetical protein IH994_02500 [Proteobacteria bacterium]|nr:hypothetical protein [Pseudomonadota bacterium]
MNNVINFGLGTERELADLLLAHLASKKIIMEEFERERDQDFEIPSPIIAVPSERSQLSRIVSHPFTFQTNGPTEPRIFVVRIARVGGEIFVRVVCYRNWDDYDADEYNCEWRFLWDDNCGLHKTSYDDIELIAGRFISNLTKEEVRELGYIDQLFVDELENAERERGEERS